MRSFLLLRCMLILISSGPVGAEASSSRCADFFNRPIPRQGRDSSNLPVDRAAWKPEAFTDPRVHDAARFRYLVHAAPHVGNGPAEALAQEFLRRATQEGFDSKLLFSASAISEARTTTFNRYGVILDVPAEKIFAATSDDMRSHASEAREDSAAEAKAASLFRRAGLPCPARILEATAAGVHLDFDLLWNEVLIYGRAPAQGRVAVSGFFHQADSLGTPLVRADAYAAVVRAARETGLPLVAIRPPAGEFVISYLGSGGPRARDAFINLADGLPGPVAVHVQATREEAENLLAQARSMGKMLWGVDPTGSNFQIEFDEVVFSGGWRDHLAGAPISNIGFRPDEKTIRLTFEPKAR